MKRIKRCLPILLVCALLMATTSFATVKASEQLARYNIYAASMGNGKIGIDVSVTATGIMKEVGVQNIFIYKLGTYGYELVESYDKDDPGMIATNTWEYVDTIYYQGETGEDYQVVVSIYAKDTNNNSDSRSRSFNITT